MLGFIFGYYNLVFGLYGLWKFWGVFGDNFVIFNGWYI